MLDLTVKTLDSLNHSFSCEDDITVRGFKEHIAQTVAVEADSQRLIYCGRVLQDEKKLNDYDVQGKVIHLVQRAPPQPETRGSGSGNNNNGAQHRQSNNSGGGGGGGGSMRYRGHFPRNAMYLGAMSVPTEVVEGQGMPPPRLSNTLSNSRLEAAKRMLEKASRLMDRLDDPAASLHPSPTESNASGGGGNNQQQQQQQVEPVAQPQPQQQLQQPTAPPEEEREPEIGQINNDAAPGETRDRLGRTVSEIAASFAAAHLASLRSRDNGDAQSDESGPPRSLDVEPRSSDQGSLETERTEADQSETSDSRQEPSTSNLENGSRRSTQQVPRPPQMAQLLETLVTAQDRLRPYIDRYRVLMSLDPVLTAASGPDGIADNQRVIDGVSESLHYLSHACHALSDIIVDMGQQPPRNLRCRPIIIQHSAILQAGIPIQIEPHISIARSMPNNNNNNSSNNNNNNNSGNGAGADESNEVTRPSSPDPATEQVERAANSAGQAVVAAVQNAVEQQSQSAGGLLGTILNLPSNVEVSMEFSPMDVSSPGPADGSEGELGPASGGSSGSSNNNSGNVNANGNVSTGNVVGGNGYAMSSPLALIRDALQSVLNDRQIPMDGSGGGTGGNAQANMPYVTIVGQQMDIIMTNSGQSTQARSNIGTHPTTSTQTRSTSRPHVLHPHAHMGMGMGQNMDFDPFLPCNSHHIRRSPAAAAAAATAAATAGTNATAQQSGQPSQAAEGRPRSQSVSFNTSTARPQVATESFTIGADINAGHDILHDDGQAIATGIGLAMTLGELLQGSVNDSSVHISFVGGGGAGSSASSSFSPGQINLSQNSELPLTDLLRLLNVRLEDSSDGNFLNGLWIFLLRNLTFGSMMQLSHGQPGPLINLRRPLREYLEQSFPNSTSIQRDLVEQLVIIDRPCLRNLVSEGELANGRIDVPATLEAVMRKLSSDFFRLLFNNDLDDTTFAQETIALAAKMDRICSAVLQHIFQGQQSSLEATAVRLLNQFMGGIPAFFQQTLVGMLTSRIRAYAAQPSELTQDEVTALIVYKDDHPPPAAIPTEPLDECRVAASSSVAIPLPAPPTAPSDSVAAAVEAAAKLEARAQARAKAEARAKVEAREGVASTSRGGGGVEQQQQQRRQKDKEEENEEDEDEEESSTVGLLPEILALPEMQGVDKKLDMDAIEPLEGLEFEDDSMDLANGEEIPETIPGAEEFPPEWVAVMARDQVRQRKQAAINAENGGPIPYSDAYLSVLPSKRRKLIEQQKPAILAQPRPGTTASVMHASVERLVHDGIGQTSIHEVEGAARAVASAPGVRTAFGHAIRDSIHPGRLRTPDFPNARRFPNATKYFTNGEQSQKESRKQQQSQKDKGTARINADDGASK